VQLDISPSVTVGNTYLTLAFPAVITPVSRPTAKRKNLVIAAMAVIL